MAFQSSDEVGCLLGVQGVATLLCQMLGKGGNLASQPRLRKHQHRVALRRQLWTAPLHNRSGVLHQLEGGAKVPPVLQLWKRPYQAEGTV